MEPPVVDQIAVSRRTLLPRLALLIELVLLEKSTHLRAVVEDHIGPTLDLITRVAMALDKPSYSIR